MRELVETIRLESGHTLTGIGGSNPSLSAIFPKNLQTAYVFRVGTEGNNKPLFAFRPSCYVPLAASLPCAWSGRIMRTTLLCACRLAGVTACVYVSSVILLFA